MSSKVSLIRVAVVVWFVLGLGLCNVKAVVWFDDGGVHQVDYAINDSVQVWNNATSNQATTVNVISGGNLAQNTNVYQNSRLNIYGGSAGGVFGRDDSVTNIFQTVVIVGTFENSTMTIAGGGAPYAGAHENSQLIISGGVVGSFSNDIRADGFSHLVINGGTINSSFLDTMNDAEAIISGGKINSELNIFNSSKITLVGSHFRVNDMNVGLGELSGMNFPMGSLNSLSGKLANGDYLNVNFTMWDNAASIVLIPEPATMLLVGLGGVILRKGRRKI